jgi:hypothetical protein
MLKSWRIGIVVMVGLVAIAAVLTVFVLGAQAVKTRPPVLSKVFDKSPTGFTLRYPDGWEYIIPTVGVMVMGAPETLFENQPGPTFGVQRGLPLSISGSLDEALNSYLQSGPLRVAGRWVITVEIKRMTLEGRDARMVELVGSDQPNGIRLHTRIIATTADNTFVYLFITTAPSDEQARFEPLFKAILDSVAILE